MTHGGYRRRHVQPMLSPQQVLEIRACREAGLRYKVIEWLYNCSRYTIYRASKGLRTYAGYTTCCEVHKTDCNQGRSCPARKK